MKAFIDRFVYFNCPENRPKIKGKSAILAIPFEEDNLETAGPTLALFERSPDALPQVRVLKPVEHDRMTASVAMKTQPDGRVRQGM